MADLRILIVDDQRGIRSMLKIVFAEEGYEVTTAANGLEALEKIRAKPPHLVLMDVKMPVMDGIQALKEIRKAYTNLPVVIMTAYAEIGKKEQALNLDVADWLYKPLDIEELKQKIRKLLEADCNKDSRSLAG